MTNRYANTNEPDRTCCACGKEKVPVIFRDGKQVMILTCDSCLDPVCHGCADVDEDGTTTCSNCLQDAALKK